MAEFSKGSGYSKGDLVESGTPIILYGRLYTKYETSISDVDTYVEAKEGSIYSKGGEVIVPASGETAEDIARATTVDKSGILLGGDLNIVVPNEDINSAFLAISISNGNSQRELAKKAQVKEMWLTHFSPSLVHAEDYMPQVREIFPNAFLGKDGKSVELMFEDEKN